MDIKGWDIVYVLKRTLYNRMVKKYFTFHRPSLKYQNSNSSLEFTIKNIEIENGGSSKFIRIKMDLIGELSINGYVEKIDGISPLFEINVDYFNKKEVLDAYVSTVSVDLNNKITETSDPLLYGVLSKNLKYLLLSNQNQVVDVFQEAAMVIKKSNFNCKEYKLAMYNPTSGEDNFIIFLCVVTNRDTSKLDNAIDGAILDTSHEFFMVLSQPIFFENIIMPWIKLRHLLWKPGWLKFEQLTNTTSRLVTEKNKSYGFGSGKYRNHYYDISANGRGKNPTILIRNSIIEENFLYVVFETLHVSSIPWISREENTYKFIRNYGLRMIKKNNFHLILAEENLIPLETTNEYRTKECLDLIKRDYRSSTDLSNITFRIINGLNYVSETQEMSLEVNFLIKGDLRE